MSRLAAALATCLAIFLASPVARAAEATPEAIVRDIYAAYGPESWPEDPAGDHFSADLLARYIAVEEAAAANEEPGVGFDVFINAQDIDSVTNLTTRVAQQGDDRQLVDVTFTAFEQEQVMRYTFVATDDGWKIDNIAWGEEGANLRALLDEVMAMQADGGFGDDGVE